MLRRREVDVDAVVVGDRRVLRPGAGGRLHRRVRIRERDGRLGVGRGAGPPSAEDLGELGAEHDDRRREAAHPDQRRHERRQAKTDGAVAGRCRTRRPGCRERARAVTSGSATPTLKTSTKSGTAKAIRPSPPISVTASALTPGGDAAADAAGQQRPRREPRQQQVVHVRCRDHAGGVDTEEHAERRRGHAVLVPDDEGRRRQVGEERPDHQGRRQREPDEGAVPPQPTDAAEGGAQAGHAAREAGSRAGPARRRAAAPRRPPPSPRTASATRRRAAAGRLRPASQKDTSPPSATVTGGPSGGAPPRRSWPCL